MPEGMVGGAVEVTKSLVSKWPPALLALIVLNLITVGAFMWHQGNVIVSEERVVLKRMDSISSLIKACVDGDHPREQNQGQDPRRP
jgi:hypothetical protein